VNQFFPVSTNILLGDQFAFCLPSCKDSDGDTVCDEDDPCDFYPNTLPINGGGPTDPNGDANGDGIPNECQCGDTNGDGFLLSNDASSIFACGGDPLGCATAPPDADLPPHDPNKTYGGLWDTNLDGFLLSNDASAIFGLPGLGEEYKAQCGRRPEGTPAP
jgi:hypothetical protein